MAIAIVAAAVLLSPCAALAENWVNFFIIPQGVVFVDHDSIDRRAGHVSARLESTFPEPQRLNHDGKLLIYVKVIDSVDVDCKARVYMNVSRDLYSDLGVLLLSLYEGNNPQPVARDTPQEAMIKAFCR